MLSYPDFQEKTVVIVFALQKQKYSFLNDNLVIKDEEDKIILQTTCHRVLALWIVGNGQISTGLLERAKKFAFPILILSQNFRCTGIWSSPTEGNFLLRQKQYVHVDLSIAKHLVVNKITNQIATLNSIRKKEPECKDAISKLRQHLSDATKANDLQVLLGLEGVAAKTYFSKWFTDYEWKGRKPRAKIDITNVLLDMGYTFLFYFIENMLSLYGFDLYKGVYHTNFYKRKSLVCDLQEPFRCIIDKQIKKSINLGQVKEEDFELINDKWVLKYGKNKEYTQWMLKGLLEYKADIFLYCQSYYRAFMQAKPIAQYPIFDLENTKERS